MANGERVLLGERGQDVTGGDGTHVHQDFADLIAAFTLEFKRLIDTSDCSMWPRRMSISPRRRCGAAWRSRTSTDWIGFGSQFLNLQDSFRIDLAGFGFDEFRALGLHVNLRRKTAW